MQASRRKTGLFGKRFDLSSAERLAAEEAVPSEKTVAGEADFEKASGFAEGIQCTVAVVAEPGRFAAVPGLESLYIEVGAGLHQSQ